MENQEKKGLRASRFARLIIINYFKGTAKNGVLVVGVPAGEGSRVGPRHAGTRSNPLAKSALRREHLLMS